MHEVTRFLSFNIPVRVKKVPRIVLTFRILRLHLSRLSQQVLSLSIVRVDFLQFEMLHVPSLSRLFPLFESTFPSNWCEFKSRKIQKPLLKQAFICYNKVKRF